MSFSLHTNCVSYLIAYGIGTNTIVRVGDNPSLYLSTSYKIFPGTESQCDTVHRFAVLSTMPELLPILPSLRWATDKSGHLVASSGFAPPILLTRQMAPCSLVPGPPARHHFLLGKVSLEKLSDCTKRRA